MYPCTICKTYDGFNTEIPTQITLHSTPHGNVCGVCIKMMVKHWEILHRLLYDAMHCLDNDFVPGPKFADLWQRYYDLTGYHEGDEYIERK